MLPIVQCIAECGRPHSMSPLGLHILLVTQVGVRGRYVCFFCLFTNDATHRLFDGLMNTFPRRRRRFGFFVQLKSIAYY